MKFEEIENIENLIQLKNLILLILILIDLIFIITISVFNLPKNDLIFMADYDLFLCVILALNLIGEYYNRDCSTKEFFKEHIIDILSIIPYNFIFLRYLTVFRVLRILQILQIVKFANYRKHDTKSFRYFVQNQLLRTLIVILIIYMIISSIILFAIDDSFTSLFQVFWYGIVTITGVGYGDVTPSSNTGKIIGVLTIIIGVLFISVFTAAMSAIYMEKPEEETRKSIETVLMKNQKETEILKKTVMEVKEENIKLNKKIDELKELLEEKN